VLGHTDGRKVFDSLVESFVLARATSPKDSARPPKRFGRVWQALSSGHQSQLV